MLVNSKTLSFYILFPRYNINQEHLLANLQNTGVGLTNKSLYINFCDKNRTVPVYLLKCYFESVKMKNIFLRH